MQGKKKETATGKKNGEASPFLSPPRARLLPFLSPFPPRKNNAETLNPHHARAAPLSFFYFYFAAAASSFASSSARFLRMPCSLALVRSSRSV